MGHGQNSIPVIARSEATTRLRLLRKLRRPGSPPKLGERRRKQSSFLIATKKAGLLRFARNDVETAALILATRFARGIASSLSLLDERAQGKPGAGCTRRSRALEHTGTPCTEAHGQNTTGTAETSRLPLRNGLAAYTCSPRGTAFLAPVAGPAQAGPDRRQGRGARTTRF